MKEEDPLFHYNSQSPSSVDGESDILTAQKLAKIEALSEHKSTVKKGEQHVCGLHSEMVDMLRTMVEYSRNTRNDVRSLIGVFLSMRRWLRVFVAICATLLPVLAPLAWEKWVGSGTKPGVTATGKSQ